LIDEEGLQALEGVDSELATAHDREVLELAAPRQRWSALGRRHRAHFGEQLRKPGAQLLQAAIPVRLFHVFREHHGPLLRGGADQQSHGVPGARRPTGAVLEHRPELRLAPCFGEHGIVTLLPELLQRVGRKAAAHHLLLSTAGRAHCQHGQRGDGQRRQSPVASFSMIRQTHRRCRLPVPGLCPQELSPSLHE
jgi:hypothetical protein